MALPDPRTLSQYMWAVTALAVPVMFVVSAQALHEPLPARVGLAIAIFSSVLVLGEMWPIPVARGQEAGDEITVSSTFGFALLLVGPVFYAIAAQALALGIDWAVRRRAWQRRDDVPGQFDLVQRLEHCGAVRHSGRQWPGAERSQLGLVRLHCRVQPARLGTAAE